MPLSSEEMVQTVRPYSKMTPTRLRALADALADLDRRQVPGDVALCGVWKGGIIALSRMISPDRPVWAYDTFTGMTKPTELDTTRSGKSALRKWNDRPEVHGKWMVASVDEVISNLRAMGVRDEEQINFIEGDVTETLKTVKFKPRQIALLHLDTDWHASTKIELEVLFPLLCPGGVLIVDDYEHWQGCRRAVDDYFNGHPFRSTQLRDCRQIDYTSISMVKV